MVNAIIDALYLLLTILTCVSIAIFIVMFSYHSYKEERTRDFEATFIWLTVAVVLVFSGIAFYAARCCRVNRVNAMTIKTYEKVLDKNKSILAKYRSMYYTDHR